MTQSTTIKPGDIVSLPFWMDDDSGREVYRYEVESLREIDEGRNTIVTFIKVRNDDGVTRVKNSRGHFSRRRELLSEIKPVVKAVSIDDGTVFTAEILFNDTRVIALRATSGYTAETEHPTASVKIF